MSESRKGSEETPSHKASESSRNSKEVPSRHSKEVPSRHSKEVPSRHSKEVPSRHSKEVPSRHSKEVPSAKHSKTVNKVEHHDRISSVYTANFSHAAPPAAVLASLARPSDYTYKPDRPRPSVRPSVTHSVASNLIGSHSTPSMASTKKKSDPLPLKEPPKPGYCRKTIPIPPDLPDFLKQYAKGALKTQPPDLLLWSGTFFRALANAEVPPVKDRLEDPNYKSKDGLTPGLLRVIDTQLGGKSGLKVSPEIVMKKLQGFGLKKEAFETIIFGQAGGSESQSVDWDQLLAGLANTIGNNLTDTMIVLCQVLTDQQDGFEPFMNYKIWLEMYTYLATNNGVSAEKIQAVNEYLLPISYSNSGVIGPRDFNNSTCPTLQ